MRRRDVENLRLTSKTEGTRARQRERTKYLHSECCNC